MTNSRNNYNQSEMWDRLLSEKAYILDQNPSVVERMQKAGKHATYGKQFLNIGSGQGYFEKLCLSKIKFDIFVDTDISITGLVRLSKYPIFRVNSAISSLPFKCDSFDFVMCMEVLEHISIRVVEEAYSEIKRVTIPSGNVLFSVPVFEPTPLLDHKVGHLRKYTPDEFYQELSNNGFLIKERYYFYSFSKFRKISSLIASSLDLRRPSVIMVLCQVKKP